MRTGIALFILLFPWSVFAQEKPCDEILGGRAKQLADSKQKLASAGDAERDDQRKQLRLDINEAIASAEAISACTVKPELEGKIRLLIEKARVDKQVGAGSSSSGSTSAVSGGSIPALLGLALESGGITKTVSGNSVTYRSNPAKLISAIAKQYGQEIPPSDPGYLALNRIGVGVTFNTGTSGTASSSSGTDLFAKFRQVSEVSARAEIINHRDLFSQSAFEALRKMRGKPPSEQFMDAARVLFDQLDKKPWYREKKDQRINEIVDGTANTADAIEQLLASYFEDLRSALKDDAAFRAALNNFVAKWSDFKKEQDETYARIAKSQILTFEYALSRPAQVQAQATGSTSTAAPASASASTVTSPDIHVARLIYANRFIGDSEFTLNASAGLFGRTLPTMRGAWRDAQFSGKLDIPLPELPQVGKSTLTFSGLFMHLHQKPLGFDLKVNDVKINQPGNLGLFQAKYSIPLGDSGVSVPISLTVSNRTELIKEKDVRGNIGMTFDLDKLFAKR